MKKIVGVAMMVIMVLVLTACGVFGSRAGEDPVDDLIDTFDGSLKHLQPLSESVADSDDYTMSFSFATLFENPMDPDAPRTLNVSYYESFSRSVDGHITETQVIVEVDGETFEMHTITVWDQEKTTYYFLADRLLDELQKELDLEDPTGDLREMFAIEHDMVKLSIDHDMVEAYGDLVGERVDNMLALFGFNLEEIEDTLANTQRFNKYASIGYYDEHEHVEVDVERIDDTTAATVMTLNAAMLQDLIDDFLDDMIALMQEMDMPDAPASKEELLDYDSMMDDVAASDPLELRILHDPGDPSWMSFEFDFLPILDVTGMKELYSIEAFTAEVFMSLTSEIDLPTDYTDANDAIDEYIKLLLVQIAHEDVLTVAAEYVVAGVLDEGTYTLNQAKTEAAAHGSHMFLPPIFAKNKSTLTISAFAVSGDFYYIDETPVFNDSLTLDALNALMATDVMDRDWLLDITALVDAQSYDYKYFLIVFMDELDPTSP